MEYDPIQLSEDLSYEERPIQILDRKEHTLCTKTTPHTHTHTNVGFICLGMFSCLFSYIDVDFM